MITSTVDFEIHRKNITLPPGWELLLKVEKNFRIDSEMDIDEELLFGLGLGLEPFVTADPTDNAFTLPGALLRRLTRCCPSASSPYQSFNNP